VHDGEAPRQLRPARVHQRLNRRSKGRAGKHGNEIEDELASLATGEIFAHCGRDASAKRFDGLHELCVGQGGRIHLKSDARDAAQRFTVSYDLVGDFVGAADQQRAIRAPLRVEVRTSAGTPAALLADVADRAGVAGIELIRGLLRRGRDVAERVNANLQLIGLVTRSCAGFAMRRRPLRALRRAGVEDRPGIRYR
jgi:hypothetical protein